MGRAQANKGPTHRILAPLRDFFTSHDEAHLERAYTSLHDQCAPGSGPLPQEVDWEQTLFGFNKLFVGPQALLAPPYASVWLEPEPQLMGQSTLQARHIYEMLGLGSPWRNKLPEDHVSFELDALLAMHVTLACKESPAICELHDYFLSRHVLRWMPRFCSRVLELEETPPAVATTAEVLQGWLQEAAARIPEDSQAGKARHDSIPTSDTPEVRS